MFNIILYIYIYMSIINNNIFKFLFLDPYLLDNDGANHISIANNFFDYYLKYKDISTISRPTKDYEIDTKDDEFDINTKDDKNYINDKDITLLEINFNKINKYIKSIKFDYTFLDNIVEYDEQIENITDFLIKDMFITNSLFNCLL